MKKLKPISWPIHWSLNAAVYLHSVPLSHCYLCTSHIRANFHTSTKYLGPLVENSVVNVKCCCLMIAEMRETWSYSYTAFRLRCVWSVFCSFLRQSLSHSWRVGSWSIRAESAMVSQQQCTAVAGVTVQYVDSLHKSDDVQPGPTQPCMPVIRY